MQESGIQRPAPEAEIYDQTEARSRRLVLHLVWLLPCLVIFGWFFTANFQALHMPEAMEAAQMGRHVSRGEGFTTSLIRPFSLDPRRPITAQPATQHAPLYPLVLAIAFNLSAPEDRTVALVSTLFGVLTALMAFLLVRKFLDQRAAWLAALLVSLNVGFLSAGVEGADLTLLGFLITLLGYLLVRQAGRLRDSAWCGVVCALLYLTDFAMLPLLAVVAVVTARGQSSRRLLHAGACLVGFAVLVLPWLVRDWRLSGGPFTTPRARTIASYTDIYPQTSLFRETPKDAPSALKFLVDRPREVAKKTLKHLSLLPTKVAAVLEGSLLLLFGLTVLADLGGRRAHGLRRALLLGAVLILLSLAMGDPRFDVVYMFVGVLAAFGATGFVRLLRAREFSPRATAWATAGLLALAALPLMLTVTLNIRPSTPDRQSLKYLKEVVPAGQVVVTDEPWTVAWYADRPAVWLPQESVPDAEEQATKPIKEIVDVTRQPGFAALEQAGAKPYAIFLTSRLPSYAQVEQMVRWQWLRQSVEQSLLAVQSGKVEKGAEPWAPEGWVLAASLPPGEFLFLREEAVKQK